MITNNASYLNINLASEKSTDHAIIELTDKSTKAIDEGKYTIGIFLDLSKAFDTINHQILLNKLKHYGITKEDYV